jgi:hypothetical protein
VDNFNSPTIVNETQKFEESVMMKKNADSGISITINRRMGSDAFYNFSFGGNASSGFVTLKEMRSVIGWIRSMQKSGMTAPLLISDVTIDGDEKRGAVSGSTPYYLEKYKLEFLLEKYMKEC